MADFGAYFVWEALEGGSARRPLLSGLEAADDVLECGRHNKVLLLQTKFFSFKELQRTEETTEIVKALVLVQKTLKKKGCISCGRR